MDLTVGRAALAAATANAARLLPTRRADPVLSGLLLTADADGLRVAGVTDERAVRLDCPATVHVDGEVLVPGRPLAETLAALESDELRVAVEASMLVLRTPSARFALPLLDTALHPGVRPPPPALGTVAATAFAPLLSVVAAASSADLALPMFTGVRLRAADGVLRLVATDRYRMAVAALDWDGEPFDLLVPAAVLAEVARQSRGEVTLHGDGDRFALGWAGGTVATALLATPFVDEQRYLDLPWDAAVEVDAAALAGAVRRVGLFADGRGAVQLDLGDGEVRVRSTAEEGAGFGDAAESVKATVTGSLTHHYRSGYLLDALRGFGEARVRIQLLGGMKATVLGSAELPELRYVVMPILARQS